MSLLHLTPLLSAAAQLLEPVFDAHIGLSTYWVSIYGCAKKIVGIDFSFLDSFPQFDSRRNIYLYYKLAYPTCLIHTA